MSKATAEWKDWCKSQAIECGGECFLRKERTSAYYKAMKTSLEKYIREQKKNSKDYE